MIDAPANRGVSSPNKILHAIILSDYEPTWPRKFLELDAILRSVLGKLMLTIEHVGSTAVEGLPAKPILDIDLVIENISLFPTVCRKLNTLGYHQYASWAFGSSDRPDHPWESALKQQLLNQRAAFDGFRSSSCEEVSELAAGIRAMLHTSEKLTGASQD